MSSAAGIAADISQRIPLPHTFSDAATVAVPPGYQTITEGGAIALYKAGQVFYNQVQIFNRDLSIMAISAWDEQRCEQAKPRDVKRAWGLRLGNQTASALAGKQQSQPAGSDVGTAAASALDFNTLPPMRILEALSASGLRSMRYARELPAGRVDLIIVNDLEREAQAAIQQNIHFNRLQDSGLAIPNAGDAVLVMHLAARGVVVPGMEWIGGGSGQVAKAVGAAAAAAAPAAAPAPSSAAPTPPFLYDVIDLDPYGTAAPFLDSAISAIADGGLLAVTCTDMAVLAGNHMDVCHSKYGSLPAKARHYNEQALRIVLACIEGHANRHKKTIKPLLSISVDFYVRVFVTVHSSPLAANDAPSRLANIHQCTGCDAYWLWPLAKGGANNGRGLWSPPSSSSAASAGAEVTNSSSGTGAGAAAMDQDATPDQDSSGVPTAGASAAHSEASGSTDKPERLSKKAKRDEQERRQQARVAGAGDAAAQQQHQKKAAAQHKSVSANTAPDIPCACPHCGRSIVVAGPIWLDPIHDQGYSERVLGRMEANFGVDGMGGTGAAAASPAGTTDGSASSSAASSSSSAPSPPPPSFYSLTASTTIDRPAHDGGSNNVATVSQSRRRLMGVIRSAVGEAKDLPLYSEVSSLSSRMRCNAIPLPRLEAALTNAGYRYSGSHCAPNVVKTDAPWGFIWDMYRAWARMGNKTIALDSRGDARATPAGAGPLGSGAPATTAAATASGGAAEDATADDGASSGCRTYVPARIRRLAALPLDQALLSADSEGMSQHGSSGAPTAINFEPSAALAAKYQEAKDRKARGEGVVRFVPNPQEGWGPKARAHGNTNAANAATTVGDAGADDGGARQAGGKKQQRGGNLKASSSSGASSTLTWEPGLRSSAASTAAESTAAPPSRAVAESNGGAYDKNGDRVDGTGDGHGDSTGSSGSDSKRSRLE